MSERTVDIHVDTSLVYDPRRGWQPDHRVYVRLHRYFLDSGLLAALKGNELKTFLALALQARRLEPGPLFEHLAARALATESDLGTIICYQWQEVLADQAGLHRNTLSKQLDTLIERRLVERRMMRDAGARYGKPLFLIYAGSLLEPEAAQAENLGAAEVRAQELCPVQAEKSSPAEARAQILGTIQAHDVDVDPEARSEHQHDALPAHKTGTDGLAEADTLWAEFGRLLGRPYVPGDRDYAHVQTLLDDGYTLPDLLAGLRRVVAQARARKTAPRTFGYCVPAIRDRPPGASRDPRPIPRPTPCGRAS